MPLEEELLSNSVRYIQFSVQDITPLSEAAGSGMISQATEKQYSGANWHVAKLGIVGENTPAIVLIRLNAYPLKTARLEGGISRVGDNLLIVDWDTKGNNLCLRVEESSYQASLEDRRKLEDGC